MKEEKSNKPGSYPERRSENKIKHKEFKVQC